MNDKTLLFTIVVLTFLVFFLLLISFKTDKTRLLNGVLLNILLLLMFVSILMAGQMYDGILIRLLFFIAVLIFLIVWGFGLYIILVGCFINAIVVFKRERRSIANMLTLFIGIILFLFIVLGNINFEKIPSILKYILIYLEILLVYFMLSFYNYFVSSLLYGIYKPKYDKDYIIVLGSGLIDGNKVSKLLGSRIDRAILFYKKQKANNKNSKLIFSGGQGADETIPEALAMKKYAIEKGIEEDDILLEDKSKSTLENFKFSKKIIESISGSNYKAIFSTSNYHVFRAAIYAKQVNLNISGIGAKTAIYYLPNAMIREYIAIVFMKKKSYILKVALISLIFLLYVVINIIVTKI
ncbi:YdcF family protein [Miniphocaeibacter halophilus]|uniref:YdcF family protein n=1 Tax=Miniphocaeibacter halophilus TaxID=2931922 RepID=A0AC61MP27_9FIRM|nr:YdcF family protein [Miniphocaeibacter halophilus]QQK07270.1 YdcF family protein [Miniphocaeibacter halophilus]